MLKLRRLQTDLAEAQCGPAICGRLRGQVFQFAMSLRGQRSDTLTGQIKVSKATELLVDGVSDVTLIGAVICPRKRKEQHTYCE